MQEEKYQWGLIFESIRGSAVLEQEKYCSLEIRSIAMPVNIVYREGWTLRKLLLPPCLFCWVRPKWYSAGKRVLRLGSLRSRLKFRKIAEIIGAWFDWKQPQRFSRRNSRHILGWAEAYAPSNCKLHYKAHRWTQPKVTFVEGLRYKGNANVSYYERLHWW